MLKAIVASVLLAGIGAVAAAQAGDEDQVDLADGWHLHPSMCLLHHQDESEWVLGLRYSDSTIEYDVSSRSLRGLEHGATVPLDLVLDGTPAPIELANSFVLEEGAQGYAFVQWADQLDRLKGASNLELRSGGRTVAQVDLAGVAAALDAGKACHEATYGVAMVDDNMMDDYSIDENAM